MVDGTFKQKESVAEPLDAERIQRLMERLHAATGLPCGIVDRKGEVLVAVGWQEVCRFHRTSPLSVKRCRENDTHFEKCLAEDEYHFYRCQNGLWDVATPIVAEGVHMATLFFGQFFLEEEETDLDHFRRQARDYGFDEEAYLKAVSAVPVYSREHVRTVMDFYVDLAKTISSMGEELRRRRVAEKHLGEQHRLLGRLLDSLPNPIFHKDNQGIYRTCNTAFADLLGREREEIIGSTVYDVASKKLADVYHEKDMELMRRGGIQRYEATVRAEDGVERHMLFNKVCLEDEQGELEGLVGVMLDLTEQRNQQDALRQSEQRYADLFANMLNGCALHEVITDDESRPVDYRYLAANKAFGEQTGLDVDIQGRRVTEILPDIVNDPFDWIGTFGRLAIEGGRLEFEQRSEALGRWFAVAAFGAGEGRFAVTFNDITERKRIDQELKAHKEELEHRVAEIGRAHV